MSRLSVPNLETTTGPSGQIYAQIKKAIKKGLKVMCRETRMAVAAAQLAIADAGFAERPMDPEMSGVVLGSDYMLTMPEDYSMGMKKRLALARLTREGTRLMGCGVPRLVARKLRGTFDVWTSR